MSEPNEACVRTERLIQGLGRVLGVGPRVREPLRRSASVCVVGVPVVASPVLSVAAVCCSKEKVASALCGKKEEEEDSSMVLVLGVLPVLVA